MSLVSTHWLSENINKVKIIDASWHLVKNRKAIEEYNKEHIENAVFFDLDKNSNREKYLPHGHFLPSLNDHEKSVSTMGILNTDRVTLVFEFVTFRLSNFHFFIPPFNTQTNLGSWPK